MNVVFIGHVDAGKSTTGGQILYLTVRLHAAPSDFGLTETVHECLHHDRCSGRSGRPDNPEI